MSHIEQISHELTWRIRREVLYPGQPLDKIILPDDENGMHLGLFDDNKLIKWTGPSAKDVPVNIADFTQKEPAIIAQALLALKQLKVE